MNPIVYHNAMAAVLEAQKACIQSYEQQLAEMREQNAKLEAELAALRTVQASNGAVVHAEA